MLRSWNFTMSTDWTFGGGSPTDLIIWSSLMINSKETSQFGARGVKKAVSEYPKIFKPETDLGWVSLDEL